MENLMENKNETTAEGPTHEPVKNFQQYVVAVSVTLFLLVCGTVLGWTSPTVPMLEAENSKLPITKNEVTWIGSLTPLGAMIGPFPGGITAEIMGRKKSLLLSGLLVFVSWTILAAAQSTTYLYIGRFIAGVASGWGMTAFPMYIGEIASPNLRGPLGVIGQIQICLGFLYVYTFGAITTYVWLCILCGALPLIFLATFAFMPETPYYLVLKGDIKAATESLQRLRGQSERGVKQELNGLQIEVEQALQTTGTWGEVFTQSTNRRAIFIVLGLMALQQFSGINVVLFYSETIFAQAGSSLSPSACTIVVGIVMTVASLILPFLIETFGRRPVTLISAAGMTLSLICLGVHFYLAAHELADVKKLSWLPLTSIIAYICTYSIGAGPVPWMMISEVFAPSIRGKGAAFSSSSSWVLAFIMTKFFKHVEDLVGSYGAFWIFAASCTIFGIWVYFYVPETKGKTLQEIQDMLKEK